MERLQSWYEARIAVDERWKEWQWCKNTSGTVTMNVPDYIWASRARNRVLFLDLASADEPTSPPDPIAGRRYIWVGTNRLKDVPVESWPTCVPR